MKKLFLILLLFLSANSCTQDSEETKEADEIDLTGKVGDNGTRSLSTPASISAISYPDYIEVILSNSQGNVVIRIYNDANAVVYENTVTAGHSRVLIDTTSMEAGTYSIEFTDSEGGYMEGYFAIG